MKLQTLIIRLWKYDRNLHAHLKQLSSLDEQAAFDAIRDADGRMIGMKSGLWEMVVSRICGAATQPLKRSDIEEYAAFLAAGAIEESNAVSIEITRMDREGFAEELLADICTKYPTELGSLQLDHDSKTIAKAKHALDDASQNILESFRDATDLLGQFTIEQRSGHPLSTVKRRLKLLEQLGMVHRPHGQRKGYALTSKGRELLESY